MKKGTKELKITLFRAATPCSPLKVNQRFGGIYRLFSGSKVLLDTCFRLVFCSPYSSTLEIEAISSETSVYFQRTTRQYIPDNSALHIHCCENLKSYV
jgi:hypothetical protein